MPESKYLIVGGGMAADAAVRGIREVDPKGSIAVVTAESAAPYKRPPLTKGLWKGEAFDSIWLGTEKLGVELVRERRILGLDPAKKTAVDDRGASYGFGKALLATGGRRGSSPSPTRASSISAPRRTTRSSGAWPNPEARSR